MIKLIASDLDGTLLPEGTPDIDPKVYEVIRSLQNAGVTFVAASGRNYESVMSIFGSMEKELLRNILVTVSHRIYLELAFNLLRRG